MYDIHTVYEKEDDGGDDWVVCLKIFLIILDL